MLAEDIAKLMTLVPLEEKTARSEGKDRIEGGAFNGVLDKQTPFMFKGGEGINAGMGEADWVIQKDRAKYDKMFDLLGPVDGKISGAGRVNIHLALQSATTMLKKLLRMAPLLFTIYHTYHSTRLISPTFYAQLLHT